MERYVKLVLFADNGDSIEMDLTKCRVATIDYNGDSREVTVEVKGRLAPINLPAEKRELQKGPA